MTNLFRKCKTLRGIYIYIYINVVLGKLLFAVIAINVYNDFLMFADAAIAAIV